MWFLWWGKKSIAGKVGTLGAPVYVNPSPNVSTHRNMKRIERLELSLAVMPVDDPDRENLERELRRRFKIRDIDKED